MNIYLDSDRSKYIMYISTSKENGTNFYKNKGGLTGDVKIVIFAIYNDLMR